MIQQLKAKILEQIKRAEKAETRLSDCKIQLQKAEADLDDLRRFVKDITLFLQKHPHLEST